MQSFTVLLLLLALVACSTAVSAQNNCNNPLFTGNSDVSGAIVTAPIAAPAGFNEVCPNIAAGGTSCCGPAAAAAMKTGFTALRNSFKTQVDAFENQKASFRQVRNSLENIRSQLLASFQQSQPTLTAATFNTAFDAVLNALDSWVNGFSSTFSTCVRGILRTTAGIFCMACDPNWSQYVSSSGTSLTLSLRTSTCTSLQNDCLPVFTGINGFMTAWVNLISLSGQSVNVPTGDTLCGGISCANYICQTMVRGTNSQFPSFGGLSTTTSTSLSADNLLAAVHRDAGFKAATRAIQDVLDLLSSSGSVAHHNSNGIIVNPTATTTTNTYSDTGYAAYSTGSSASSSTFDTSSSGLTTSSATSSMLAAPIALLAAVATALALLA